AGLDCPSRRRATALGLAFACRLRPARDARSPAAYSGRVGSSHAIATPPWPENHATPPSVGPLSGALLLIRWKIGLDQATVRPRRWRFLSTEPGRIAKCTWPSPSTATTRTTARPNRFPASSIAPGVTRDGWRASDTVDQPSPSSSWAFK